MKNKIIIPIVIIAVVIIVSTILIILNFNNGRGDFKIVDNNSTCDTKLYQIFEDEKYIYYLECEKEVFLEYENGYKIEVKEALSKKKVTISELREKTLSIIAGTK